MALSGTRRTRIPASRSVAAHAPIALTCRASGQPYSSVPASAPEHGCRASGAASPSPAYEPNRRNDAVWIDSERVHVSMLLDVSPHGSSGPPVSGLLLALVLPSGDAVPAWCGALSLRRARGSTPSAHRATSPARCLHELTPPDTRPPDSTSAERMHWQIHHSGRASPG